MLTQLFPPFLAILATLRDPDVGLTTDQLIESRGFRQETHFVTTEDGYILTTFRIVNPLTTGQALKPVILLHGMMSSSTDFVINAPGGGPSEGTKVVGNNLGFELAKRGYDVWLPNCRGNRYSLNHTTLNPIKDMKFWDVSMDQMGEYDLPAVIDYIQAAGNYKTVSLIGHSAGVPITLAAMAMKPKYNDIIKPFVAMAPAVFVSHLKSPFGMMAHMPEMVEYLQKKGGPFFADAEMAKVATNICAMIEPVMTWLCENMFFFMVGGWDSPQINATRIPVYVGQDPAGTPTKNVVHFIQWVLSGRFQMYDYGKVKNTATYGTEAAPVYPLDRITNENIVLMTSLNDGLVQQQDVDVLRKSLKVKLLMDYIVPDKLFNHLDFIWAKDSSTLVNSVILDILDQHA